MAKHGPYIGVAGYFDDSQEPADDKTKNLPDRPRKRAAPVGFGGHDDDDEFREKGALPDLCAAAVASTSDAPCTSTPAITPGSSPPGPSPTRCHGSPQRVQTPGVGT